MANDLATIYHTKAVDVSEIPAGHDLVLGSYMASEIQVTDEGAHKQGELLMSSGNNEFSSATSAGLASAVEICILTRDCDVAAEAEGVTFASGYFMGTFNPNAIVLPYETEDDDHAELIAAIKTILRRHNIFLN